MKKFFTIMCATVLSLGMMNAKVLLTESFDREAGTLNVGMNTDMGTNTTDWWSYSGSSNYIQVVEGSLSYAGYASKGQGNKAKLISGSAADDFRQFAPVTDGKVYLAAIIHIETPKSNETADYWLTFGDATASNMYGRLYTKTVKDGSDIKGVKFGVAKYNESAAYVNLTEEVYAAGTDYLVVLEYEFVEGDNNDVARLYINPTKGTTEATVEVIQSGVLSGSGAEQGASAKKDAGKIASVDLRQGTNTPASVFVDEIKVTTEWGDLFEAGGESGMENIQTKDVRTTKVLLDGQVVIMRDGKAYDIFGRMKD